jgi:hypothetical protein
VSSSLGGDARSIGESREKGDTNRRAAATIDAGELEEGRRAARCARPAAGSLGACFGAAHCEAEPPCARAWALEGRGAGQREGEGLGRAARLGRSAEGIWASFQHIDLSGPWVMYLNPKTKCKRNTASNP